MPANIPSPISGAGGSSSRGAGEQLLLGIAHQIFGNLLQAGMQKMMPTAPPTPQQQQMQTEQRYATQQLGQQVPDLGNANAPTAGMNKTAMRGLAAGQETAPMYAEQVQQEETLASLARIRARTLAGLPEHLRAPVETIFSAKDSGAADSTINDLLPHILPPTDAQALELAKGNAELDELKLKMRQMGRDDILRDTFAQRLGLPNGSHVTDGMIGEWQRQNAPDKPVSPQDMAERLLTTLVSRSVVDPITGQANPAFSIEDAAMRTEQGMQLFVPGFKLNLSEEQRAVAEASGVLRAAIAREKMNDPRLKDDELADRVRNKFMADFPMIPADRLEDLITEAIRSNILTGFGG